MSTFPVAHLADDIKPLTTLCGLKWEPWQEPGIPTDEEIGFDGLGWGAKLAVREADKARDLPAGTPVHQCQACFKASLAAAVSTEEDRPMDR